MVQGAGQDLPQYQYSPLQGSDVRLVYLLPGLFDDDLTINIIHFPLSTTLTEPASTRLDIESTLPHGWELFQTPEGRWFYFSPGVGMTYDHPSGHEYNLPSPSGHFEALSYAWGDTTRTHRICVEPTTLDPNPHTLSLLSITQNLDIALRYLRHLRAVRIFWIDALSTGEVNQGDLTERSSQILRMQDIFRVARRVIAWLGPADEDIHLAFNILRYLGQQVELSVDDKRFSPPHATEITWPDFRQILPYTTQQWMAIQKLFQMQWMTRLWVLQEIYVAPRGTLFQCGYSVIDWFYLRRAINLLYVRAGAPNQVVEAATGKIPIAHNFRVTRLLYLLHIARRHSCSDSRDKIYGVMAFLGAEVRRNLRPSYAKNFESVYQDLFLNSVELTHRLDLLSQSSGIVMDPAAALPSWVPDWRFGQGSIDVRFLGSAAGMSRAFIKHAGPSLHAQGTLQGTVFSASPGIEASTTDTIRRLRSLQVHDLDSTYVTGEKMLDAWAGCLILGRTKERCPYDAIVSLVDWKQALLSVINSTTATSEQGFLLERFAGLCRLEWRDLSFFTTTAGYFGFGPRDMQKDDRICIFLGLFAPMIVRPAENSTFKIVGGCYVHGLMDGEVLLGPLPPAWSVKYEWSKGRFAAQYYEQETNFCSLDDPRLGPLPVEWQRVERDITADDPEWVDFFENIHTGEIINYDPRMTLEMLKERGVDLQTISLV